MVTREAGTSLVEAVITVALLATVMTLAAPVVMQARDAQEGRQAAVYLAGQFRAARQQAIMTGRHTGFVFDRIGDTWKFRRCEDRDADGLLRADISAGIDSCDEGVSTIDAWFPRTTIDRAAEVPDLSGHFTGAVVAFGTSGIASFAPLGSSSSGSVTVRTRGGRHYAVRVAGVTGRIRMLRFASETGRWIDI
ncbi:MAG: hypothetical protein FJW21_05305 [Acidimicrobiia bacterium]|nr:hypothetical protein [Acidimicrobiia bacterium]